MFNLLGKPDLYTGPVSSTGRYPDIMDMPGAVILTGLAHDVREAPGAPLVKIRIEMSAEDAEDLWRTLPLKIAAARGEQLVRGKPVRRRPPEHA